MDALWLLLGLIVGASLTAWITHLTKVPPATPQPMSATHPEWPAGHTYFRIGNHVHLRHPGCPECEALARDDK